jgi:hypothetical protein
MQWGEKGPAPCGARFFFGKAHCNANLPSVCSGPSGSLGEPRGTFDALLAKSIIDPAVWGHRSGIRLGTRGLLATLKVAHSELPPRNDEERLIRLPPLLPALPYTSPEV